MQARLETDATARVSDIALGVILLVIGVFALGYGATHYAAGTLARLGPRSFPSAVAGLLCVVALALLARAALRRSPPPIRRSRALYVAIVAAVIAVLISVPGAWVAPLFLRFGPGNSRRSWRSSSRSRSRSRTARAPAPPAWRFSACSCAPSAPM